MLIYDDFMNVIDPVITAVSIDSESTLSTAGTDTVRIDGTGLGAIGATLLVTYGPNGNELTATSCDVVVTDTRIECTSIPG